MSKIRNVSKEKLQIIRILSNPEQKLEQKLIWNRSFYFTLESLTIRKICLIKDQKHITKMYCLNFFLNLHIFGLLSVLMFWINVKYCEK